MAQMLLHSGATFPEPQPAHTFYRPHGKSTQAAAEAPTKGTQVTEPKPPNLCGDLTGDTLLAHADALDAAARRSDVVTLAQAMFVLQIGHKGNTWAATNPEARHELYRKAARETLSAAKAFLDESRGSADGPYTEPVTPKEKP